LLISFLRRAQMGAMHEMPIKKQRSALLTIHSLSDFCGKRLNALEPFLNEPPFRLLIWNEGPPTRLQKDR
jgi:hypothetical protein